MVDFNNNLDATEKIIETKQKIKEKFQLEENGIELFRLLAMIFRSLQTHDIKNEVFLKPVDAFIYMVNSILDKYKEPCEIKIVGDLAIINGVVVKVDRKTFDILKFVKKFFKYFTIGSIKITNPLDRTTFFKFIECVHQDLKVPKENRTLFTKDFNAIKLSTLLFEKEDFFDDKNYTDKEQVLKCYTLSLMVIRDCLNKLTENKPFKPSMLKRVSQNITDLLKGKENIWLGLFFIDIFRGDLCIKILNTGIFSMILLELLEAKKKKYC